MLPELDLETYRRTSREFGHPVPSMRRMMYEILKLRKEVHLVTILMRAYTALEKIEAGREVDVQGLLAEIRKQIRENGVS